MEDLQGHPKHWTRWQAERQAANDFISAMNSSTDRLGLVRYSDGITGTIRYPGFVPYSTIRSDINGTTRKWVYRHTFSVKDCH